MINKQLAVSSFFFFGLQYKENITYTVRAHQQDDKQVQIYH